MIIGDVKKIWGHVTFMISSPIGCINHLQLQYVSDVMFNYSHVHFPF